MIVFGTRSYELKSFKPEELGLYTNEYEKYTFLILQNYFHLYWIPLFPTGTTYAFRKAGSSDKFHAPESFQQLMMQQQFPWWHRLGALAIPILALVGFILFTVSEKMEHAKYAKQFEADKKEMTSLLSDKTTLQKYAQKVKVVDELVLKNYKDKKENFVKIDTSFSKVMEQLLKARFSMNDTTTAFDEKNTIIYHYNFNSFIQNEKNEVDEKALADIWETFGGNGNYVNSNVIKWYKSGMTNNDIENTNPISLESTNDIIEDKKYLAVMRINGFASPILNNDAIKQNISKSKDDNKSNNDIPAYVGGYVSANVYVYDIEKNTFMYQFKIFAHNSETIHTYQSDYENIDAKVLNNLHRDLLQNLNKEIEYALRIGEREVKEDDMSSL